MALHHRTHPEPVDGCYGCKLVSIQAAPHGYAALVAKGDRKQTDELAAYKRLRRAGLQPDSTFGADKLERTMQETSERKVVTKADYVRREHDKLPVAYAMINADRQHLANPVESLAS